MENISSNENEEQFEKLLQSLLNSFQEISNSHTQNDHEIQLYLNKAIYKYSTKAENVFECTIPKDHSEFIQKEAYFKEKHSQLLNIFRKLNVETPFSDTLAIYEDYLEKIVMHISPNTKTISTRVTCQKDLSAKNVSNVLNNEEITNEIITSQEEIEKEIEKSFYELDFLNSSDKVYQYFDNHHPKDNKDLLKIITALSSSQEKAPTTKTLRLKELYFRFKAE